MTDTEKIAALAAELQRIGKMPKTVFKVHGKPYYAIMNRADKWMRCDEAALAALSGVAAEICAYHQRLPAHSALGYWVVQDFDITEIKGLATYHDALIAALKQVEVTE